MISPTGLWNSTESRMERLAIPHGHVGIVMLDGKIASNELPHRQVRRELHDRQLG